MTLGVRQFADEGSTLYRSAEEELLVVEVDGLIGGWSPTRGFTGDPEIVAAAEEAARGRYRVEWGNLEPQIAHTGSWIGALTALMYLRPGRTLILDWPDEVRDWWTRNSQTCGMSHAEG